jgi:hypothetical protein
MSTFLHDTPLVAHYKGDQGSATTIMTGVLLCSLGVISLIGAIAAGGQIGQLVVFLAFAAFLLRFGGGIMLQWWRNRGVAVEVYENGLMRGRGAEQQRVQWDDIRIVWQHIVNYSADGQRGRLYVYTIETVNGERLIFSNEIAGIDMLGPTIQNQVQQRLFPKFLSAYENGETVWFAPFSISKDGIGHKGKYLTWAEIEGAKVEHGYVVFKQQGGWLNWANVATGEIANMPSFLNLIDHIVGLKRGI